MTAASPTACRQSPATALKPSRSSREYPRLDRPGFHRSTRAPIVADSLLNPLSWQGTIEAQRGNCQTQTDAIRPSMLAGGVSVDCRSGTGSDFYPPEASYPAAAPLFAT